MQKKVMFASFFLLISLLFTACNLPGFAGPAPTPETNIEEQVQQTVDAKLTQSANDLVQQEITATSPPADPVLPQPSPTNTFAPTPTETLQPTPSIPTVQVSVDTNCRFGPHVVYDYLGALMVGETAEIVGKEASGSWLLINNPDQNGLCWVSTIYAETNGDLTTVPLAELPPFFDWNGTYEIQVDGSPPFTMILAQDGASVSGTADIFASQIEIIGTLSENGQVLIATGTNHAIGASGTLQFRMLDTLNQFQGSLSAPGSPTAEWCGSKNGAVMPTNCMWP